MALLTQTAAQRHIKDKFKLLLETNLPFIIAQENATISSNEEYQIKKPWEIIAGTPLVNLETVKNSFDFGPVINFWFSSTETESYDGTNGRNVVANLHIAVYEAFDLINGTYTAERAQRLLDCAKTTIEKFGRDPNGDPDAPACIYRIDISNDTLSSPATIGDSMWAYVTEAQMKIYYRVGYEEIPTLVNTQDIGLLPYVQSNYDYIDMGLTGTLNNLTDSAGFTIDPRGYSVLLASGSLAGTGSTYFQFDNLSTSSLGASGSYLYLTLPQGPLAETLTTEITSTSITSSLPTNWNWQIGNVSYCQILIMNGQTNVPYPYSLVVVSQ